MTKENTIANDNSEDERQTPRWILAVLLGDADQGTLMEESSSYQGRRGVPGGGSCLVCGSLLFYVRCGIYPGVPGTVAIASESAMKSIDVSRVWGCRKEMARVV